MKINELINCLKCVNNNAEVKISLNGQIFYIITGISYVSFGDGYEQVELYLQSETDKSKDKIRTNVSDLIVGAKA